jgi:hypothetical protein
LAIQPDNSNDFTSSICQIEMTLDDEKTIEVLMYDITEKMNDKLHSELVARFPKVEFSKTLIKISLSTLLKGYIEVSEASKSNQPKGCSFDLNQVLK